MARRKGRKKGYQRGSGKTGRINMKRAEGGWVNQYGVFFTDKQRRALRTAVKKSNKKREEEIEAERALRHIAGGQDMGEKSQLRLMGKENEFIVSQQHADPQKFKSLADYENYMRKQKAIVSGEYVKDRARAYKRNFMRSLQDTYGDEAKDIIMKVRMMKPEEYIKMVEHDEVLEIRYVPSDMKTAGRLNQLRTALGMKEKDEWADEEYD